MKKTVAPLSPSRHGDLALRTESGYRFAAQQQLVPLWGAELVRGCHSFPIAFHRRAQGWTPVAITGLGARQNVFVDGAGRWLAGYTPALLRAHPFVLVDRRQEGDSVAGVIEDDPALVRMGQQGSDSAQRLFDPQGRLTPALERVVALLRAVQRHREGSQVFFEQLERLELLEPWPVEQAEGLEELYRVSERRLGELDAQTFGQLRAQGLLTWIYAHLLSTNLLERLDQARERGRRPRRRGRREDPLLRGIFGGEDDLFEFH
ncbi:SapC family protein [Halorhodospira halochloris]|uniref:SapC family protein n=1 Tax=Halorhodospira halochloris TaxID=1052 RepID=UPI001EE8F7FE|nr:SapC family protein [Halorhodospira halochloris]MCG5531442.1 SapC family protein [Halorhodospira halochloris]